MSPFFSYASSAIIIISVIIYFFQVKHGSSVPNASTWTIVLVVSILNSITYILSLDGDFIKGSLTITMTIGVLGILIYCLKTGKFGKISNTETLSLSIGLVMILVWKLTNDIRIANLFLQLAYVVSFYPTVKGLLKHTLVEKHTPWTIAIVAYSCMITGILLDWEHSPWTALAYPIVDGILGNGTVAVIALYQRYTNTAYVAEK